MERRYLLLVIMVRIVVWTSISCISQDKVYSTETNLSRTTFFPSSQASNDRGVPISQHTRRFSWIYVREALKLSSRFERVGSWWANEARDIAKWPQLTTLGKDKEKKE